MKKRLPLFFLSSFLLSASLEAGVLDGIGGAIGSIGNTVSNGVGTVTNNETFKSVIDFAKKGSYGVDDLNGIFGSEAIDKLKGLGAGANVMYKYCYDFTPPSVNSPISILNPCDVGALGANLCDKAPDLSLLGFSKRNGVDLKSYCRTLGKEQTSPAGTGGVIVPPTSTVGISKNVKGVNTTNVLKDRYEKIKKAKSGGGSGSSGGSGGSGGESGTIASSGGKSLNNSSIALNNNKDNQEVAKVIYQNNYKGYKLLEDANSISSNTVEKVDLSTLSNGYETIDEYRASVDDLTQIFYMNENNINLTYLKNTAELVFANINSTYPTASAQEAQKTAESATLLKMYEEQLDLWKVSEIQKKIWITTKENEQIVYPTEEMLDLTNDTNARIGMVYYGEKNKNEKAKLVADVESIVFDAYEKAKNVVEMAKINSRTFDRTEEYQKILASLSSIK